MKIGFIGLGNMAGAIIRGLRKGGGFTGDTILGCDIDKKKEEEFSGKHEVVIPGGPMEVAKKSDTLVLAVKPQQMDDLLKTIRTAVDNNLLVISLAAGKPLAYYAMQLGNNVPVVLAMPNINAKIGASVTALCPNDKVTPEMLESAIAIFEAVGSVTVISADKMNIFSALGGAAPAFVYLFIDALATAGVKYGLPRPMAQQIACDMLEGSAKAVRLSSEHPRAMMDQVTSPGGTTIEGVHRLAALGFEHAVHEAVRAVVEKTEMLEGK